MTPLDHNQPFGALPRAKWRGRQYRACVNAGAPDLRAIPPAPVTPCPTCGELTGRGYPSCLECTTEVDQPLVAAWAALPDQDPALVADAPVGTYPWRCVDWALRQLRCAGCRGELAAGAPDCVGCAAANSARWEIPHLSAADRRFRTATVVLRTPAWHRQAVVSTWRLVLPFLMRGVVIPPDALRQVRTQVLAGRYDELAEVPWPPLAIPLIPWRRPAVQRA